MPKTNIVILGGGFAGIAAALGLEKFFKPSKTTQITLVDEHAYHLFNPNLYEAAAAAEELQSLQDLKKSIGLPFAEIFKARRIEFIQSEVRAVDVKSKVVALSNKKVDYDYLVLALGSSGEYFNIPGAKEFGMPLKSLPHALKIKNAIEFVIEAHKYDTQKNYVRIVIAGGGYAGVELAGEIKGLIDYLSWKYVFPREKILIEIFEASNGLMPGMGPRASKDAAMRLNELGIKVRLLAPVTKVVQYMVELLTGERTVYDCLIWTAGVRARPLPQGLSLEVDAKGRVKVDEFLRAKNYHNIFAIGDQAAVLKSGGQPVPDSAQDAEHQGQYLAKVLPVLMQNRRPKSYIPKPHGFIVSVGGKWAILNYPPFYFTGRFAYFMREVAHLRYFASLIGWRKAIKLVLFQADLYSRND